MREAIGSSWLIYLVIIFIMVYVFFIAFIMNYASAYRAANYIITEIENCQGRMDGCKSMSDIKKTVTSKYHYHALDGSPLTVCYFNSGNGYIFRADLPVDFSLPFVGTFGNVHVRAETKTIPDVPNIATIAGFTKCKK